MVPAILRLMPCASCLLQHQVPASSPTASLDTRGSALSTPPPYTPAPMFGSHLSISGNMSNALREAESLDMDTVQVFTKNQQQWKVAPLPDDIIQEWKSEVARLGWQGRTVAHA